MTDYSELKRLAEAANAVTSDVNVEMTLAGESGPNQAEIDAVTAFMGMATPAAVLALVAESERLAEEVELDNKIIAERDRLLNSIPKCAAHGQCVPYAIQWVKDIQAEAKELLEERDQLKAENEALRKLPTCWSEVLEQSEANDELLDKVLELGADAERYRFLCDKFGETKLPCALERILAGDLYVADGKPSIDSAIDAAMSNGEQA